MEKFDITNFFKKIDQAVAPKDADSDKQSGDTKFGDGVEEPTNDAVTPVEPQSQPGVLESTQGELAEVSLEEKDENPAVEVGQSTDQAPQVNNDEEPREDEVVEDENAPKVTISSSREEALNLLQQMREAEKVRKETEAKQEKERIIAAQKAEEEQKIAAQQAAEAQKIADNNDDTLLRARFGKQFGDNFGHIIGNKQRNTEYQKVKGDPDFRNDLVLLTEEEATKALGVDDLILKARYEKSQGRTVGDDEWRRVRGRGEQIKYTLPELSDEEKEQVVGAAWKQIVEHTRKSGADTMMVADEGLVEDGTDAQDQSEDDVGLETSEEEKPDFVKLAELLQKEPKVLELVIDAEDLAVDEGQVLLSKLEENAQKRARLDEEMVGLTDELQAVEDGSRTEEIVLEKMGVDVGAVQADEETGQIDLDGDGAIDYDVDDAPTTTQQWFLQRFFSRDAIAARKEKKKNNKERRIRRSRNNPDYAGSIRARLHDSLDEHAKQKTEEVEKKKQALKNDAKIFGVSLGVTLLSPLVAVVGGVGGVLGGGYGILKGAFDAWGGSGSKLVQMIDRAAVNAHDSASAVKGGIKETAGKALVGALKAGEGVQEVQEYLEKKTPVADNKFSVMTSLNKDNVELYRLLATPGLPEEVRTGIQEQIQANRDLIASLRSQN